MRKIIYIGSIAIGIVCLIQVTRLLLTDRSSNFDTGFLAGQLVLLLLFSTVAYFLRNSMKKKVR